jgi:hypothetical protein
MRNLWNIDLWSVRPAELHSAAERQRTVTIQEDSGQPARWAHRQDAYVPISTNSHERPTNTASHPSVAAATEGTSPTRRSSLKPRRSVLRESVHAREVPHFVRDDGRKEE